MRRWLKSGWSRHVALDYYEVVIGLSYRAACLALRRSSPAAMPALAPKLGKMDAWQAP